MPNLDVQPVVDGSSASFAEWIFDFLPAKPCLPGALQQTLEIRRADADFSPIMHTGWFGR